MELVDETYMKMRNDIIGQMENLLNLIAEISLLSKRADLLHNIKNEIELTKIHIMEKLSSEYEVKKTEQKNNTITNGKYIEFIIEKINYLKSVDKDYLSLILLKVLRQKNCIFEIKMKII